VPPPIPASSQQKEEIASSAVEEKPFRKIGKDTSPVCDPTRSIATHLAGRLNPSARTASAMASKANAKLVQERWATDSYLATLLSAPAGCQ
jgi:hypothetical protein